MGRVITVVEFDERREAATAAVNIYKRTKGSRRMPWDAGTYPSIRL